MSSTHQREFGALLRLAAPLVAVNVGNMLMGVVDTAIAGRIDELSLGATGLGATIIGVCAVAGIGVILGMDPVASQAVGANDRRLARRALWSGIYAAQLAVIPAVLMTLAIAHSLEWIGVEPALASKAREYIHPRLLQFAPFFALAACRSYLQAEHCTWPMLVSTIAANIVNGFAGWGLVYGSFGLPCLGVAGLGWATVLASLLQLAITSAGVLSVRVDATGARAIDGALIRRIFQLGWPIGLQLLAEGGIFSLVGLLIGRMGSVKMAAHNVALTVASMTFMIPLGVSMATSVRVGNAIGRGDAAGARRAGLLSIGLGAAWMAIMAAGLILFPAAIASAFTNQPSVIAATIGLLQVAAAFQLFDGVQVCSAGALRGAGITRWPFGVYIVCFWAIGLPLGLVLSRSQGAQGLWWGLTVGLAAVAVAGTLKFCAVSRGAIKAVLPPGPADPRPHLDERLELGAARVD